MKNLFIYISLLIVTFSVCSCGKLHTFNDTITLNRNDKIPYGTYVAYQLLQKEFPHARIETNRYAPAEWRNLTSDSAKQVLIIITKTFEPSEQDLDYLTGFVQKGNYVFISALQYTRNAVKFFNLASQRHFNYYGLALGVHSPFNPFDSVTVQLDSALFQQPLSWNYPGADFANEFLKTDSAFTYHLGYASNDLPNLVAINSIDGRFFIHSAPFTFTNFFLLYENNRQYLEKLMSLFPSDAKKIVWDEYFLNHYYNQRPQKKQGLLSVILKYDNFRWAFWVALLLLSLCLITEVKRRQRIIPVYAKPENDSLEFVTTIGRLYYEKADHKNLADKLTQYFLDYVRNRYKVATSAINDAFVQQLAAKSGKPSDDIMQLVDAMHAINLSGAITQNQLMDYYRLLEKFYTSP
ncbi:DUF4350 domain-containing protein [Parafilimonas sp.]|uniref:DUF4350 domain-containing protein n=1 Tax=Parafilimonas sp. TaxID=1969739 RepID=UPI0039E72A52